MSPTTQSKGDLYADAEVYLKNGTSDPLIRSELARLLWTDDDFDTGEALLDEARTLEANTSSSLGSQVGTTADLKERVRDVNADYMDVLTVLRDVISDADLRRTLELDASRVRYTRFNQWLEQARSLFDTALGDPDTTAALADAGVPASFLTPVRDAVEAVAAVNARQESRKEAYQSSSERLQQVRAELRDWCSCFRRRARRALRSHPQKLEALTLSAPTDV